MCTYAPALDGHLPGGHGADAVDGRQVIAPGKDTRLPLLLWWWGSEDGCGVMGALMPLS